MGTFKSARCVEQYPGVGRCSLPTEHSGEHKAISTASGLFVQWTTQTTEELTKIERASRVTKRTTPIKSWRWWVIGRRGILSSITSGTEWFGPVMTTKQLPDGSLARVAPQNPAYNWGRRVLPDEDYGVYSYKTPDLLLENAGYSVLSRGNLFVLGQLESFGHVVEHELGYRSQKVIIQSIWVFYSDSKLMFNTPWRKSLEHRYECGVEFVPDSKLDSWSSYFSKEELE